MPHRPAPAGYMTATEAIGLLGKKLYRYVKRGALKRYTPPGYSHGYYKRSEIEALQAIEEGFFERGEFIDISSKNATSFAQMAPDDLVEVYAVAASLFPHGTTSAEGRRPLLERCPPGNYIVREFGQVVAYIHLQPLKQDRLQAFLQGKIRGWQLTADDLDCFAPGKTVDVLLKSMGATRKYGERKATYYTQRLLLGVGHEIARIGHEGCIIRKLYATSETPTGIAMSLHAGMKSLGRIGRDPERHDRYAFELDVATSDLPLLREYHQARAECQAMHGHLPRQAPESATVPKFAPASTTPKRERQTRSRSSESQIEALPPNYTPFGIAIKRHSVPGTSAWRALSEGKITAHVGDWRDERGHVVKQALDPGELAAFCRYFASRGKLHQCDDPGCPCHD